MKVKLVVVACAALPLPLAACASPQPTAAVTVTRTVTTSTMMPSSTTAAPAPPTTAATTVPTRTPSPTLTGSGPSPKRSRSQCHATWNDALCSRWVAGTISTRTAQRKADAERERRMVTDRQGATCKQADLSAGGYCHPDGRSSAEVQSDWQAIHDRKAARCRARGGVMSGEDCLKKGTTGYKDEQRRRREAPDFYATYPDGQNYDYCPDGTPTQDPSAC